ncbi:MAG: hypothetical protein AAF529_14695 [Pseudomonadota bacterium]
MAATQSLGVQGVNFIELPHLLADMPDHELWMAFFTDPDGHMLAIMEERWK